MFWIWWKVLDTIIFWQDVGPCCEQTHAAFGVGLSLDQGQGVYSGLPDVDGSGQLRLCHTCIIDVMQWGKQLCFGYWMWAWILSLTDSWNETSKCSLSQRFEMLCTNVCYFRVMRYYVHYGSMAGRTVISRWILWYLQRALPIRWHGERPTWGEITAAFLERWHKFDVVLILVWILLTTVGIVDLFDWTTRFRCHARCLVTNLYGERNMYDFGVKHGNANFECRP